MAKLTVSQTNATLEKQRAVQQRLVKKLENQQAKELLGESYKTVLKENIQKEYQAEFGSINTPKLYDTLDLYSIINPVDYYYDPDNKPLQMDYSSFTEAEEKYQAALDKIEAELSYLRNPEDKPLVSIDGESSEDSNPPVDCSKADKGDAIQASIVNNKTPAQRAKGRLAFDISTYFNRFVPLYNKHVCTCCGTPKNLSDYYITYNPTCANRVDSKGNFHLPVCKDCCQKLLMYYYTKKTDKNVELAMQYTCTTLNLYWSVDLFYKAQKDFEDSGRKNTLLGNYIKTINENEPGYSFVDSPFLSDEQYSSKIREGLTNSVEEVPFEWDEESIINQKDVIRIVGYDPFDNVKDDNTRRTLYKDFCALIDEDLAQDYVKIQSALTIVRSFLKVRQLDEKMSQMEEENAPLNEQKAVSDLKKKELDSITSFCASNGWSERFKTKVSKGETSFTGIMKQMDQKRFEKAMVNKFDIETGATMQQAADYSMNAIMKQLALSDAEVWKITQEQYQELTKLRRENSKLEEDLRKAKYSLAELKLQREADKNGN